MLISFKMRGVSLMYLRVSTEAGIVRKAEEQILMFQTLKS